MTGETYTVLRKSPSVGTPSDWIRRAHADLALAKGSLPPGALFDDLCFHAQQAAEKAIKAVYISAGRGFRYTHNLGFLIDELRGSGVRVPEYIDDAAELTKWAWEARYPGPLEPASEAEYQRALALAERVVEWAESMVDKGEA